AHPDRRLALSGRRSAGGKRHSAGLKKKPGAKAGLFISISRSYQAAEALIQSARRLFGAAPTILAASSPSLNRRSVGIERTPNWAASSGFSSILTLAILT